MSEEENRASPEVQEQEPDQPAASEPTQEEVQQQEPQVEEAAEPVSESQPEAQEPEAEKPAEGEPEGDKDAEKSEDKPAEEEAKKEEEAEPKEEVEEEPEPPIVISPEGNPHWLSTEDVLAKDLPESEVENFKNYHFRHAHSLQTFYEVLKDSTVPMEFVTLSKEEIEALTVEGDVSEEQQQVLDALQERINAVIELYENDGALVKINGRTGKDAILEKKEEAFVQTVRDAVINALEVEKQSSCAYSIWKDQEHHPGAFKRGITKLRNSFRRPRTGSAGGRRRPKLEEEKKGDDAPKDEEKKEEAQPAEGGEAAPKEETEEAEGGAKVTVEADVEATEDKPEEKEEPKEEAAAEPSSEEPKEEAEAAAKPPTEEPREEEAPKEEAPKEEEPKEEVTPAEAPKENEEGDKKEDDAKPEEEEKKEDGEIQPAAAEEDAKKEEKPQRKSTRRKQKPEDHHQFKEAKAEPLDNRVLRAFGRVMGSYYRVQDGKAALEQLRSSSQIRSDLNKLKAFSGVEGVQVSLSVCRWLGQIPEQTGMLFRGFVYNNELNAVSQYNDTTYFPNVVHYKDTVITGKVQQFFQDNIKEPLKDLNNYIIDFFVAPDKVYVLRLNPFYTAVGACLFTWNVDGRVLTKGPFEFRVVNQPKTAPDAYSSYQPWWDDMLKSVLQSRKDSENRSTSSKCVIL